MKIFSGKKEIEKRNLIEQVILENYNQYYRLAFSYVHNAEDASDIVQNGAYKALKNCHSLKYPAYARTWAYRIMLNECFRHMGQPSCLSYEAIQDGAGMKAGFQEDRYEDIDLQRAVDALPDKEKAIIIMKYFEDKKLEEIADILEENVNTVKSRLYRCMKKLRGSLSSEPGQDGYKLSRQDGQVII